MVTNTKAKPLNKQTPSIIIFINTSFAKYLNASNLKNELKILQDSNYIKI